MIIALCYIHQSINMEKVKMNKLSKEKYFNYGSKELLGVIRLDFCDGRLS